MKTGILEENHRYFYKRTKVLRKIGLWPISHSEKPQFLYKLYVCLILAAELTSVSCVFIATLKFSLEQKEFNAEVCEQIILFGITFQMLLKMLVIAHKAKYIQKLIDDLSVTMRERFANEPDEVEIMKDCRRKDHKMSKFFCILIFTVLLAALVKPLAHMLKRMHKNRKLNITDTEDIIGELPTKYPFIIYEKSMWYPIVFVQQVTLSTLGAFTSWAVDTMLFSFMNYLCGHFDILANSIKNYQGQNYLNDNKMVRKLVEQHQYLINYAKEYNSAFAPLIVMQLGLGAVTIGLQMIQLLLIKSASPFAYAKPISYLSLKFFQLHIFCWHGQMLWDRSVYIKDACYNSVWFTKSKNWCMCLQIIMMRSYKPIKVEIASLFQFSLERFRSILNTSYSLFAMMKTVSD